MQDRSFRLYAILGLLEVIILIHPVAQAFSPDMYTRVKEDFPGTCAYISRCAEG